MNTTTTISRDEYGALRTVPEQVADLVRVAANRGKLPKAFDEIQYDRKGRASGEALHHEIYDINPEGSRALVCLRGACGSKYGVRTTSKEYLVVARHGCGIRVMEANKAVAAKAAKAAGDVLGVAIETALGKRKLAVKANEVRIGYKLLVRTAAGLESAWDGSEWVIGKARGEAATEDHTGGFYYYASMDEALAAAESNDVFGAARAHRRLALCEVAASGRQYTHCAQVGKKLCATKITVLRDIATTL
jgi:hypothetical protein